MEVRLKDHRSIQAFSAAARLFERLIETQEADPKILEDLLKLPFVKRVFAKKGILIKKEPWNPKEKQD